MQFLQLRSGNSGPPFLGTADLDTLLWDNTQRAWYVGPGGGGGAVSSVFGRTGAVVAQTGDYDSDQIDNVSSVAGASVSDALETLAATGGAVASVFGRTGAVVAVAGDYTASQITGGMQQVADVAARDAIAAPLRQVGMTVYQVDVDKLWRLIGGTSNANWVDVTITQVTNARDGIVPAVGAVDFILQSTGTASAWVAPLLWSSGFLSPTITQATTVGATGQRLTIAAQDAATTGGQLQLETGVGGTTPGEFRLFVGASQVASLQNSNANDFFALGANPAQSGRLRLPPGAGITSREFGFGSDLAVYTSGTGDNSQTFGSANASTVKINAPNTGGIGFQTAGTDRVTLSNTAFNFLLPLIQVGTAVASSGFQFLIINSNSGSNPGGFFRIRAMGTTSGNTNGANVRLEGGRLNGTGVSGRVQLRLNADDTDANMSVMAESAQITASQRAVSLCFPGTAGAGVTATQLPPNSGDLVIFIGNAAGDPTAAPAGGFTLSSSGGNPQIYTPNATKTTVGAAGGAAALPATPTSYIPLKHNGVSLCVPAYAP